MVSPDPNDPQSFLIPIDIESLLRWTYRNQRADVVLAEEARDQPSAPRLGYSRDSLAALHRVAMLGTRVDERGGASDDLHIDAEIVHRAVLLLDRATGALVMDHARNSTRPDQIEIVPSKPVAATDARGRNVHGYDAWDKNRNYGWCKLLWTAPIGNTGAARKDYRIWHAAISHLAIKLESGRRLTEFRVTGPAAPEQPTNLPLKNPEP